jgi:hypothetical protein
VARCALQYKHVPWGNVELPHRAGNAVCERGLSCRPHLR